MQAIGADVERAMGIIRVFPGNNNTKEDAEQIAQALIMIVTMYR